MINRLTGALIGVVVLAVCGLPASVLTQKPAQDEGALGVWQKLRKLQTTASAMHTTAHPDDEHGAMLTMLSRGQGARLSLLTLNRGESGDNAIGSELFDALGLIRTEELLLADRYYGVDRQYFTTVVDYGFSKRLDETLEKWGRENLLRDVVRVIRIERPLVLIARFQGNERDGHGNHQAAGLITQEAFRVAGDPHVFPEQMQAGLRPWQPLKLYMGGVRENEDWTLKVDAGVYDPVLGESYATIARLGLSFQRSQNGGRFTPQPGPSVSFYKRLQSRVAAPAKETSFFDGIDTTIAGVYEAMQKPAPAGAEAALATIDRHVKSGVEAFRMTSPSDVVPALARALAATRAALAQPGGDPDVAFILGVKERQLQQAITAALGIVFTAMAQPSGTPEPIGPFAALPAMPAVVPGQTFQVRTQFTNRSPLEVRAVHVTLDKKGDWTTRGTGWIGDARNNQPVTASFTLTVPPDAAFTRPYFTRSSIQAARYTVIDETALSRPAAEPDVVAVAKYLVEGEAVEVRQPVTRLEANLPYGYDTRVLAVVPAMSVKVSPSHAIVLMGAAEKTIRLTTELTSNVEGEVESRLSVSAPAGWTIDPPSKRFRFSHAGERAIQAFTLTIPALENRDYRIEAVASTGGRDYREGYDVIQHRDLETRYLYRQAAAAVRGIDAKLAPGLKVGYVMGVGDDVPSGLAQLGADVQLLGAQDLATSDLGRFDTIITGTRAYAVRDDLRTYNRRLLDYAKNGGNLIVLYNTQEFVPNQHAPFPAELPATAEEVSEEDSPVDILAPAEPVFNTPNKITRADFEHWVEQRGSKFWATWDAAYRPMIAAWDRGQAPQKGGWLHAQYGKGHYTYFAYALHRQLPYGVPGAYRLLANLLSLNQAHAAGAAPRPRLAERLLVRR